MTFKKILIYWIPPLAWMAIIFPVGNRFLSSPLFYQIIVSIVEWLLPSASNETIGLSYIIFRKSLHIIEYGILAFLLFRALRGTNKTYWKFEWARHSGLIAINYGILDEVLQHFLPSRNSSLLDIFMDITGVIMFLSLLYLIYIKKKKNPIKFRSFFE